MGQYISPNHIWEVDNLPFHSKGIYCLLGKFVDFEGKCWPGIDKLVQLSGLSKPTVKKSIKELEQAGYILIERRKGNTGVDLPHLYFLPYLNRGNDVTPRGKEAAPRGKEITGEGQGDFPGRGKDITPNLSSINLSNELDNNVVQEPEPDSTPEPEKEKIPYSEIISFLNTTCGTNYKSTGKKTRDHIEARWNEGFRVDDFKRVITNKARDWIDDSHWSKYLRPSTLFGTKFEEYLNQKEGSLSGRNNRNFGKSKAGHRPSEVDWANEPPGL